MVNSQLDYDDKNDRCNSATLSWRELRLPQSDLNGYGVSKISKTKQVNFGKREGSARILLVVEDALAIVVPTSHLLHKVGQIQREIIPFLSGFGAMAA